MTEPYVDTKVSCQKCGATFSMRLEQDTPFACKDCGRWQQAKFPCPVCKGKTVHYTRENNSWVPLPDAKHDHEPEEQPEPEPVVAEVPKAKEEPAPVEPEPEPEPEPESEEQPEQ